MREQQKLIILLIKFIKEIFENVRKINVQFYIVYRLSYVRFIFLDVQNYDYSWIGNNMENTTWLISLLARQINFLI